MSVTKDFKATIMERAMRDEAFRHGLLTQSLEAMLSGDVKTGKALMRDYVNSSIGFEQLAQMTGKSPKSLMRMFSPTGNPTAQNFFGIIDMIQKSENISLSIRTV